MEEPGRQVGGWGAGGVWRQDGQVIRAEGPILPDPPPSPFSGLRSSESEPERPEVQRRELSGVFLGRARQFF